MKIDLRSDTVTVPCSKMIEKMMSASVGDDVWEEDFTVKELENKLSNMFGMESGLFCPSGTMTNQIAIRVHTKIGDQIICESSSHIYNYEGGGAASNSGVSVKLITGDYGRLSLNQIKKSVNPDDLHYPRTKLIALENTCNKGGGSCYDFNEIKEISTFCRDNKLGIHLDGARLFNALIATKQNAFEYGKVFDSISICLSKGLGSPVGSVLLGSEKFIYDAKRVRKTLGGGMRQVGYLASAGIYALENNISRLSDDHKRARCIYEKLVDSDFVDSIYPCETNIIIFKLRPESISHVLRVLDENNILYSSFEGNMMRFVTHLNFNDEQLGTLLEVLNSIN